METVELGKTGHRVTRLGLGGCPLGGHGWGRVDDELLMEAVHKSLECGVSLFDTADVYGFGKSEALLSHALGKQRHHVTLASKCGVRWDSEGRITRDTSREYVRTAIDASLRRLRIDCIPLYYVHWTDGKTPIEETLDEMVRLRERGKIRWIGLSNVTRDELRRALNITEIQAVQVQFSLVNRDVAAPLLDLVLQEHITMITWGSLAQGLLSGKYNAESQFAPGDRRNRYANFQGDALQHNLRVLERVKGVAERIGQTPARVAIRWLLDTPGVGSVLFGAKNPRQVEENVAASSCHLPTDEYQLLNEQESTQFKATLDSPDLAAE